MKKTGFLYDDRYLLHNTGPYHPECSQRLREIYRGIEEAGLLPDLVRLRAVRIDPALLESVHHPGYIARFQEACLSGKSEFDCADNQLSPETCEVALLSAGGVVDAARRVFEGEIDNAFCAVRPPGHHACPDRAMGFCYFNNIALAAYYLQSKCKIRRVAIVDFDVHHGNGTQAIFDGDPTVFYASIHEHPSFAYPGTGREFERGKDFGYGYTLNLPVIPGGGDAEYRELIEDEMLPALYDFDPEFLLVSSGFDALAEDDMSGIRLTSEGFSWIMERLMEVGDKCAKGRVVSVLEGGYCLERLPELAGNHVKILMK